MNKNVLLMAEALSNEKDVDRELIFDALEAALASAAREHYGTDWDIRVSINRSSGEYETFRRWTVLDDEDETFESPALHRLLGRELLTRPEAFVGEILEAPLASVEFGRIGAQKAKQVIYQRVREAERQRVIDAFQDQVGQVLTGSVRRVERGNVIIDIGANAEGMIPREQLIPRELIKVGDIVSAFLYEVGAGNRGPQILLSRTRPELIMALFRKEVPEIAQGLIELKGAARDAGMRAKIAVQAKDKRIDPVGACVGLKGARVIAVTNELAGERVDIINWDENAAQFVINAMAPAEVESVKVDEDTHVMTIAVAEDNLAKAIGKQGQNVRLASELTGWKLNVMTGAQLEERRAAEARKVVEVFQEGLDVEEDVATVLVDAGFNTLEEVAYVPEHELLAIGVFDAEIVQLLQARARDALLRTELMNAEREAGHGPADDLLAVSGMDDKLAWRLAEKDILTRENLADLATDELLELIELPETQARDLIMAARAAERAAH